MGGGTVSKWGSGAGGQLGGGMERQRGRHSDRTWGSVRQYGDGPVTLEPGL
jgi:hypothetical protein